MEAIQTLYQIDQKNIKKWEKVYTDKEFYALNKKLRKKLDSIIISRKNLSPKELWMAGMIYHHGFTISSSKKALHLAQKADVQGYKPAKALIAQATDRLLQLQGKPQKFGTQAIRLRDGRWKLYKLDNSITDAQRKKYRLPTLNVLKAYLNK